MQLGPEEVLLTAAIRFRRGLTIEQLESAIQRIEDHIKSEESKTERIFIEADSLKETKPVSTQSE